MLVPSKDGIVVRKILVMNYDHVDWKPRLPKEIFIGILSKMQ